MGIKQTFHNHSSQLYLAAGIVSFVGAVVTAVMKADKIEPIIGETVDNVRAACYEDRRFGFNSKNEEYIYKAKQIVIGTAKVAKEMAVPISLMSFGTYCVCKSYNIVNDEKLAYMGVASGMKATLDTFKEATKEEVGEETYRKIEKRTFTRQVESQLKAARVSDGSMPDDVEVFTRYFSQATSNKFPEGGADTVLPFLKAAETYFNQLLHSREHGNRPGIVRFNEVLDYLGFAKVPEGEVSGWISYRGKGYIDFGIDGAYYADYDSVLDRFNCIADPNRIPRSDSGYILYFDNIDPCIIK